MRHAYGRMAVAAALICASAIAQAIPTITVNGRASNGLAPPAPSSQFDEEAGAPLARTSVSVADEAPGSWRYFALSDITTPKLQVFGALDNSGGGNLGDGEITLLLANASLQDTITITAPSSDPYRVTAEMIIDGVLQGDGSNATVLALLTIRPVGSLSVSESQSFTGDVTVTDEILSVDRSFTGDAEFDIESSLFFFVSRVNAGVEVLGDFSNTAIINLSVTTLGGDPIENVTITSESGQFGVAPIPVPAALPLMLGGLAALALRRRVSTS